MARLTAITVALALVLAAPAAARHHHHHRSACQKLKGTDLAPARTVKLVERAKAGGGRELVGCVLRRGRIRVAGIDAADSTQTYTLRQVAGRYLLLDLTSTASDHTSTSYATAVFNLKSGAAYFVSRYIVNDPNHFEQDYASFITKRGTAIASVGPAPIDQVDIRVFTSTGVMSVVDTATKEVIPPTSLRLNGNLATWLHDGTARTLTI
jgi:hypothetical protein